MWTSGATTVEQTDERWSRQKLRRPAVDVSWLEWHCSRFGVFSFRPPPPFSPLPLSIYLQLYLEVKCKRKSRGNAIRNLLLGGVRNVERKRPSGFSQGPSGLNILGNNITRLRPTLLKNEYIHSVSNVAVERPFVFYEKIYSVSEPSLVRTMKSKLFVRFNERSLFPGVNYTFVDYVQFRNFTIAHFFASLFLVLFYYSQYNVIRWFDVVQTERNNSSLF